MKNCLLHDSVLGTGVAFASIVVVSNPGAAQLKIFDRGNVFLGRNKLARFSSRRYLRPSLKYFRLMLRPRGQP
jgi:hypothetical protein